MSDQEHTASKSQRDRFIETARALGADDDEAAFRAKLAVIARQKPKEDIPDSRKQTDAKEGNSYP